MMLLGVPHAFQCRRASGWEASDGCFAVNHGLLEVEVLEAPQVRYTQDNQTPVAEMLVQVDGLRPDDPPAKLKVVGWGNLAQDLQNRVQAGQRLVLEGRLRMNTLTRNDGVKEKRAEFTLSRLHPLGQAGRNPAPVVQAPPVQAPATRAAQAPAPAAAASPSTVPSWNTSPLVPDLPDGDDDIPF
jgi:single-strand DNA-binding protein